MNPVLIIVIIVGVFVIVDVIRANIKRKRDKEGIVQDVGILRTGSLQPVHKSDMERLQKLPIAPSPEAYQTDEELPILESPDITTDEIIKELVHDGEESVAVLQSAQKNITVDDFNELASKWLARSHANPRVTTPKEAYALGITECMQDLLALLA